MSNLAPDRRRVGGADIASLLGLSPWGSPFSVWSRIVGGVQTEASDIMLQGQALEPAIAGMHMLARPRDPATIIPSPTLAHPATPHGVGHLDALAPDCVLEFKAVHFSKRNQWDAGPPIHVRLQVDWYLQCAERERAEVGAFFGLGDFRVYDVLPLGAEERGQILEVVERFWRDHVETGIPPPLDGSDAAAAWVAAKFPRTGRTELILDAEGAALAKQLLEARAQLEEVAAKKRALEVAVKNRIGTHWAASGPGVRVTYPWADRRSFDLDAALAAGAITKDVVDRFQKTTSYRTLTVKEKP